MLVRRRGCCCNNISLRVSFWCWGMLFALFLGQGDGEDARCCVDQAYGGDEDVYVVVVEGPDFAETVACHEDEGGPGKQAGEFPGFEVDALVEVPGEGEGEGEEEEDWGGFVGGEPPDAAVDVVAAFHDGE